MHKKWGYLASTIAFVASIGTVVFTLIDNAQFQVYFSIGTAISALASLGVYHIVIYTQEKRTETILRNRLNRMQDAIRRTMNENKKENSQDENESSEDAIANSESATDATAASIVDTHRDSESGLLSHSFFPVYLDQRITAARRTLRPVSLVIFTLDGLETNDTKAPSDREFFISAVGDVVKRTLRESDCGFRIDENTFAAVMDDTTESGAVWAAERVRGVLHTGALAGRVTISAGVACYPSHALEPEDLISRATKALKIARDRGVDQVEIAAEQ